MQREVDCDANSGRVRRRWLSRSWQAVETGGIWWPVSWEDATVGEAIRQQYWWVAWAAGQAEQGRENGSP